MGDYETASFNWRRFAVFMSSITAIITVISAVIVVTVFIQKKPDVAEVRDMIDIKQSVVAEKVAQNSLAINKLSDKIDELKYSGYGQSGGYRGLIHSSPEPQLTAPDNGGQ